MTNDTKPTRRPRRLRSAVPLVLSALALFAATTGVAAALPGTNTVNSGDIKNEKVKSQDLKDGSITKDDLGPSAVIVSSRAVRVGLTTIRPVWGSWR